MVHAQAVYTDPHSFRFALFRKISVKGTRSDQKRSAYTHSCKCLCSQLKFSPEDTAHPALKFPLKQTMHCQDCRRAGHNSQNSCRQSILPGQTAYIKNERREPGSGKNSKNGFCRAFSPRRHKVSPGPFRLPFFYGRRKDQKRSQNPDQRRPDIDGLRGKSQDLIFFIKPRSCQISCQTQRRENFRQPFQQREPVICLKTVPCKYVTYILQKKIAKAQEYSTAQDSRNNISADGKTGHTQMIKNQEHRCRCQNTFPRIAY